MSVRRVMGTEVEYGITVEGEPHANPTTASSRIVNSYAARIGRLGRARWDYEEESPLRDARGFDLSRADADQSMLTDDESMANMILGNGARLYVDHAHPEYSSPEVTTPWEVVRYEKAGELVMARAAQSAAEIPGTGAIRLYKNNTDNKGVSYGAHENYLVSRKTTFGDLVLHLTPFFISRQIFTGAGRVGIGQDGRHAGFQISQRADFFEAEVGLETTMRRPIINTRDEPHADPALWRRLHVIVGDANCAETAIYLKVGTTSLLLSMIEAGALSADLRVVDPLRQLKGVSHSPDLTYQIELRDGRKLTALQMQWEYLALAKKFVDDTYGHDVDSPTLDLLKRWEAVLDRLEIDPMLCADELDWVAKLALMQGYRDRDGLDWNSAKLQAIDIQYADVRPEKGLYHRLVAAGRMKTLLSPDEIELAVQEPPSDTRAYFRGLCVQRFPDEVAGASWDSIIFDLPDRENLVRIPTPDPLRGTKEKVEGLFKDTTSAIDLVHRLTGTKG